MKTILITGAGTGMGRETAQTLSQHKDVSLVLMGRRKDKLDAVLAELNHQENHVAVSVDIGNRTSFRKGLTSISPEERDIVALFANAGIGGENAYGDDDRWDEILRTNLNGTYISIMETLPYLKASKQAFKHILMTSSCLARFGVPNYTAYCTSKTGLLGLTRSLAVELASDKILVNSLCPGWVETEMAQQGIQLLADRMGQDYQTTYDQQMGFVPLERMSLPQEVGNLVDFLFSGKQNSISGQGIDINNGSWMQ